LQAQTGFGDVDARVDVGLGVGGCGEGAAGGLEDEAGDVCGDEEPVEEAGVETGEGEVCFCDAGVGYGLVYGE
jgi:hypothetical protein